MWAAIQKPKLGEFTLGTQNVEVPIWKANKNATGRITINATGDFSAGDLEIGYKNSADTFIVYTDATTSAASGYELACGANKDIFARATGATPNIDLFIQAVS